MADNFTNESKTQEYINRLNAEKAAKEAAQKSNTPPMGDGFDASKGKTPPINNGNSGNSKKKQKSPVPILVVAGVVFLWPFLLSLSSFGDIVKLALFGFIIYKLFKKFLGDVDLESAASKKRKAERRRKKAEREKEEARQAEELKKAEEEKKAAEEKAARSTGDPEIDKMIDDKEKAVIEMRRLNDAIEDPTISSQIDHLEEVTTKILDYVVKNPSKKGQVSRFFNYYLPTTLKLLNAYDRMDETGISGMNIDGTKGKVEEMMSTAMTAFDKQLDALYGDEALDVATDIKVMENLLKSEGLTDDGIKLTL